MRTLRVIGIGAGDPEHITIQGIRALNETDVFFVIEKGAQDLVALRREITARYVEPGRPHRIVEIPDPRRDRTAQAYTEAVEEWRARRADLWAAALMTELAEGESGAFLVWGDPSLYDSTIAVVEDIVARGGVELRYEVIPGISAIHALTARHRVPLNRVGGAVQITTGRRLAEGFPAEADDVVVMLDAHCSFKRVVDEDLDIYWGAYLGTPDEILVSGPLREVAEEIELQRAEARKQKGWIMDTYLLRRR
ncbi:MAG TPA: precorrin-6A synthase (deacetylating) [Solirubrobacteraceae bacterium]|nr:precorrin-6A synthase (deacetylating) [Solirubrobacteraceae bacterium]